MRLAYHPAALLLSMLLVTSLACGDVTSESIDAGSIDGAEDAAVIPTDAAPDARIDCGASMTEPGRTCRSIKGTCGVDASGPRWITAGGPTT